MNDEQSLGQNCQIRGDHDSCGKTLKFIEIAQSREFCDARKKFVALVIVY